MIKHNLLDHNVVIEPRGLGSGGLQKYVDDALYDDEKLFIPVERNKIAKPIFQVITMKKRDLKTGKLYDLDKPIYLKANSIKFEAPRT